MECVQARAVRRVPVIPGRTSTWRKVTGVRAEYGPYDDSNVRCAD